VFTSVLLTAGPFLDGAGNPMQGSITVSLSQVMSNGGVVVIPSSRVIELDVNGEISTLVGDTLVPGITFYANLDLDTVPYRGAWYQITEQFITESSQGQQRDYSIQIPAFESPYLWTFNTGTTTGTCGPGLVGINSVAPSGATELFVSVTDSIGQSVAAWVDGLVGGNVCVYSVSNQGAYAIYNVTSYTILGQVIVLAVDYVESNGSVGTQVADLALGQPITTIDLSDLMPGTPGGFNPTKNNPSGSVQWTTYLDMPEVLAWLQFTDAPAPGSNQSGLLQRLIDSACCIAQDIANRPLCPTTFQERHDGWSGEYIQLHYSPIIQLVQCQEWQSTGGFIQLPESTPQSPVEGVQVDYRTGQIMRVFAGYSWPRPFYPGSRNIEVTYVGGYDPVPHNVWMATVNLVAFWWRNWYQASRTFTKGEAPRQSATVDTWPGVPNEIAQVFESFYLHTVG